MEVVDTQRQQITALREQLSQVEEHCSRLVSAAADAEVRDARSRPALNDLLSLATSSSSSSMSSSSSSDSSPGSGSGHDETTRASGRGGSDDDAAVGGGAAANGHDAVAVLEEREAMSAELVAARAELETVRAERDSVSSEMAECRTRLDAVTTERDRLRDSGVDADAVAVERDELRRELQALRETHGEVVERLTLATVSHTAAVRRIDSAIAARDDALAELDRVTADVEAAREERDALRAQLVQLRADAGGHGDRNGGDAVAAASTASAAEAAIAASAAEAAEAASAANAAATAAMADLEARLAEATAERDAALHDVDLLRMKLDRHATSPGTHARMDTLETQLAAERDAVRLLTSQLHEAAEVTTTANAILDDLSRHGSATAASAAVAVLGPDMQAESGSDLSGFDDSGDSGDRGARGGHGGGHAEQSTGTGVRRALSVADAAELASISASSLLFDDDGGDEGGDNVVPDDSERRPRSEVAEKQSHHVSHHSTSIKTAGIKTTGNNSSSGNSPGGGGSPKSMIAYERASVSRAHEESLSATRYSRGGHMGGGGRSMTATTDMETTEMSVSGISISSALSLSGSHARGGSHLAGTDTMGTTGTGAGTGTGTVTGTGTSHGHGSAIAHDDHARGQHSRHASPSASAGGSSSSSMSSGPRAVRPSVYRTPGGGTAPGSPAFADSPVQGAEDLVRRFAQLRHQFLRKTQFYEVVNRVKNDKINELEERLALRDDDAGSGTPRRR
jgi:hypothetical protein